MTAITLALAATAAISAGSSGVLLVEGLLGQGRFSIGRLAAIVMTAYIAVSAGATALRMAAAAIAGA